MSGALISINDVGLIVNVIGTLMVAFSIGKIPKGFGGTTTNDDGKVFHFSYVAHPILFKVGLVFIIFGFVLQLQRIKNELKAFFEGAIF
ncbi:MAG: hypothetical protein HYU97_12320 [Deltaproteobacteria bacterium]|nr:hypothetical protein [Deltaproteobacteria bacterium]